MIDLSKMKNQELAEYYKGLVGKDDKRSIRKSEIVAKEIAKRFCQTWGKKQKEEIDIPEENEEEKKPVDFSFKELGISSNEFKFYD